MGGGDLNLKKSWHPLLHQNQERVWLAERVAIDEKKRLKELEKERKEERELQELRRLGGKVEERVDWLYATPAQGSGPSAEEQEAYLLGKKRVDQLFKEQDEKRLAALRASNAPGGNPEDNAVGGGAINKFQALGGNANTVRDMASKIREDPMLAIKKQELAHLEALRKDPTALRALTAQKDIDKAARKEEKRKRKEERAAKRDAKGRSRSRSPRRREDDYDRKPRHDDYDDRRRSSYRERSRSRSPRRNIKRDDSPPPRSRQRSRSRSPYRAVKRESPEAYRRPRSPPRHRSNGHSNGYSKPTGALPPDPTAAARLAAMTSKAVELQADRQVRLRESDAAEAEALKREEAERARSAKIGDGAGRFVRQENARAGELGLADRLRGARAQGMRVDRD